MPLRARIGLLFLILISTLGCSGDHRGTQQVAGDLEPAAPTRSPRPTQTRVAIVTAFPENNFYQSMLCGARQAAADLGGITIDLHGSQTIDAEEQLAVFHEVVATEPDGLILVPWDSYAFIEPVRQQVAAGLPIITADGTLGEPVDLQNITTDNTGGGHILAERMSEVIGDDAVVGVITASPTDTAQIERTEGFVERLRQLEPEVEILDYRYAESDAQLAYRMTGELLEDHPSMEGLFLSSGEAAEGAGRALLEAGRPDVAAYTFDAYAPTVALLRQGVVRGILAQSPYDMGYIAALTMGRYLQGTVTTDQLVPHQLNSAMLFLDRSNIDSEDATPFRQDRRPQCPAT